MLPEEQSLLTRPITTRTSPARDFWPAIHSIKSPHHKKFFETNFPILETISTNGKLCWNLTHQQSHITLQPAWLSEPPLFNTTWWHSCAKLHNVHPCQVNCSSDTRDFSPSTTPALQFSLVCSCGKWWTYDTFPLKSRSCIRSAGREGAIGTCCLNDDIMTCPRITFFTAQYALSI